MIRRAPSLAAPGNSFHGIRLVPVSPRTALRFGDMLPVYSRIPRCSSGAKKVAVPARFSPRTAEFEMLSKEVEDGASVH